MEKFSSRIKVNISDEFDVCLSMINYIQNSYHKEIPSYYKKKIGFFDKLYSFLN